jgi:hypothetical protein
MTSNIQRGGPEAKFPGELTAIVISCDQIGCDKTVDGKLHHYCPDHNRKI